MIKRKTTETIREFDENNRLIRETITESVEDDDTLYIPHDIAGPTWGFAPRIWGDQITCGATKDVGECICKK